jgi:Pentapeptide repeats (8 copies)
MVSHEHLSVLQQGTEVWNMWRKHNPEVRPDLEGAGLSETDLSGLDLSGTNLTGANLRAANLTSANLGKADLTGANLSGAYLLNANLRHANLRRADLTVSNLSRADLSNASLIEAKLTQANLSATNLRGADLTKANLMIAILFRTSLEGANLTNAFVYGISAWDVNVEMAVQTDLVITAPGQSLVHVDSFDVAQFIYLLLNNEKLRNVIEVIRLKVALILGRVTPEQKSTFDAIRDELRNRGYLPVLYDFDKPASRDMTEVVRTLVYLARLVIVDVTDTKSPPLELEHIIPHTSIPVVPIMRSSRSQHDYAMFADFTRHPWVLPLSSYKDQEDLVSSLDERILGPAEEKLRDISRGTRPNL